MKWQKYVAYYKKKSWSIHSGKTYRRSAVSVRFDDANVQSQAQGYPSALFTIERLGVDLAVLL
ncbi:hypothetical protein KXD40_000187 [Peronospora effusa]|uniref:Uncharacterized protein n=1 Tax=Peronospora effusa TaxID=542832 RepID=A0A3M6VHZ3_9STRA|nr:hypothetical protein DD238_003321 [Peronospora effusa]RQM12902.1 hypothetical protein DD237_005176 [Peronospora effusa]UIZ20807.1 hypothetical protein KXD40_000187 [Peronospora effusa]